MTRVHRLLLLSVVLAFALEALWLSLPEPDPAIRFTCPNADSVRLYTSDWHAESRRYVRTLPTTCGDTTAVTYGYLR